MDSFARGVPGARLTQTGASLARHPQGRHSGRGRDSRALRGVSAWNFLVNAPQNMLPSLPFRDAPWVGE